MSKLHPLTLWLGLWLAAVSSPGVQAVSLEHPYVHKPARVMAMGGADVAVGGHPHALFTNPAGLMGMHHGWQREVVTVSIGTTERTRGFVRALDDSLDIEDRDERRNALVDLIRDYRGKNLHGQVSVLPAISWRGEGFAASLTWLGSARLDSQTHQGFGEDGTIDLDARTLSGPLLGLAFEDGPWRTGITLKSLRRLRLNRTYSVRELVELSSDEGRSFRGDARNGTAQGVDVGVQYLLAPGFSWRPRLGVAVTNVGGLDFGPAGRMPQSVNIGMAFQPPAPAFARMTVSAEYADVFHQMKEDDDHLKRLRAGVEWRLWDRKRSQFSVRGGLYQGAVTGGVDLLLPVLRLGLATYAEEMGAYAGQDRERRYQLTVGLGF